MRAFSAILRQTVRGAFRSKVFYVLLALNLLAVILLPLTLAADGTATGEFQVTLTYSLKAVLTLLSLGALWLGCTTVAREIEAHNLHLVLTKPAPPWVVWCGKWAGVFAVTGSIFLISAAAVYGLVFLNFNYSDYTQDELVQARDEVLVGRREFQPDRPDFRAIAEQRYERMRADGRLSRGHEPQAAVRELERQIRARSTEVPYGGSRTWRFSNVRVPRNADRVHLRYRMYVASTSDEKQRFTTGTWYVVNPTAARENQIGRLRRHMMSGNFQEFYFPASLVGDDNVVYIQYTNEDVGGEPVIFQAEDGPALLLRVTGFANNYARGVVLSLLQLGLLGALGCAFGAAFSTPVSFFVAGSYLVLGAAARSMLGSAMTSVPDGVTAKGILDLITYGMAALLNALFISFGRFDPSTLLARGDLIEYGDMGTLLFFQVLLRGIPLAMLGMYVLTKRELGKVIRR